MAIELDFKNNDEGEWLRVPRRFETINDAHAVAIAVIEVQQGYWQESISIRYRKVP